MSHDLACRITKVDPTPLQSVLVLSGETQGSVHLSAVMRKAPGTCKGSFGRRKRINLSIDSAVHSGSMILQPRPLLYTSTHPYYDRRLSLYAPCMYPIATLDHSCPPRSMSPPLPVLLCMCPDVFLFPFTHPAHPSIYRRSSSSPMYLILYVPLRVLHNPHLHPTFALVWCTPLLATIVVGAFSFPRSQYYLHIALRPYAPQPLTTRRRHGVDSPTTAAD
ncbi:hypothetical protein R3P38DRAFT_3262345 [Favolaschia claudopus]|uniref:Uncharacterized protein n=1 Tax=Favolaschia claudopus TaxID=2862362 RepID=A0AAW0CQ08_9AGAR